MLYPIQPRNIPNTDSHAFTDGIFTEEEIQQILRLPQWGLSDNAIVGGSQLGNGILDPNIRKSQVAWIEPTPETLFIWQKITNAIAVINSQFFHFDLTGCFEPIQLGVYSANEKGHYDWHTDAGYGDTGVPRKLSMSLVLSDPTEYVGGELQIKAYSDTPKTLNVPKGRAWFFPSYVLHRVAPVTWGVRRSLVIWVGGPQFK